MFCTNVVSSWSTVANEANVTVTDPESPSLFLKRWMAKVAPTTLRWDLEPTYTTISPRGASPLYPDSIQVSAAGVKLSTVISHRVSKNPQFTASYLFIITCTTLIVIGRLVRRARRREFGSITVREGLLLLRGSSSLASPLPSTSSYVHRGDNHSYRGD